MSLIQAVLALEKLKRFLKLAKPEIWESLKNSMLSWLAYSFSRRDMQQENIRRLKGTAWVHMGAALMFWLAALTARMGLLERWLT